MVELHCQDGFQEKGASDVWLKMTETIRTDRVLCSSFTMLYWGFGLGSVDFEAGLQVLRSMVPTVVITLGSPTRTPRMVLLYVSINLLDDVLLRLEIVYLICLKTSCLFTA